MASEDVIHQVLERNKNSIRNYSTGCFCYLLVNSSAAFCLGPENLSVAKFNGNGLICLSEDVSK